VVSSERRRKKRKGTIMTDMSSFFGFDMAFNYDERKVDRYEDETLLVDTCAVSDGAKPYETAVAHKEYKGGSWIVVEAYDTQEEAQAGHDRWVATMTAEELPDMLADCRNAAITALFADDPMEYPRGSVDDD
jgi:hypothetical protein